MPVDPNAEAEITAYQWVPRLAQGYVKDLRVRWAMEETEQPYRERLVGGIFGDKSPGHLADQPFGQVPVYKHNDLTQFESGAILIHLGDNDERLLPRDTTGRARHWLDDCSTQQRRTPVGHLGGAERCRGRTGMA